MKRFGIIAAVLALAPVLILFGQMQDIRRAGTSGGGGSTNVAWGSITGTLSSQTDLQSALTAKQPVSTALSNLVAGIGTGLTNLLNAAVTNALGLDGNSTHVLLGDGTVGPVPGGGGGGTTLWYQYTANGTTASLYDTNSFSGITIVNGVNIWGANGAFNGASLTNSSDFLGVGPNAGLLLIDQGGSDSVIALGGFSAGALSRATMINNFDTVAIGDGALHLAFLSGSGDTVAIGDAALEASSISGSSDTTAIGDFALYTATIINNSDATAIANSSLRGTTLNHTIGIMGLNGALQSAHLTNAVNVTGIGSGAGSSISGALTNVVFIGNGATAPPGTANQVMLGTSMSLTAPGGFSSLATDAPVAITSTGWTNSFSKNAVVSWIGTAASATVYNNVGTPVSTNLTVLGQTGTIMLQSGGKMIVTAGTSVSGSATPF